MGAAGPVPVSNAEPPDTPAAQWTEGTVTHKHNFSKRPDAASRSAMDVFSHLTRCFHKASRAGMPTGSPLPCLFPDGSISRSAWWGSRQNRCHQYRREERNVTLRSAVVAIHRLISKPTCSVTRQKQKGRSTDWGRIDSSVYVPLQNPLTRPG